MDLELERVNVGELVEAVFATTKPLAESHASELRLEGGDCDREIMTEPDRVRQLLLNILSYAIESGDAKPVQVQCSGTDDGGVIIEVRSRGAAAGTGPVPQMLNEFIQIDADTECDSELQLCYRLSELLNGTLEMGARPGEGTTFRITLPKAPHGA